MNPRHIASAVGLAALIALPFLLAAAGTAWVRITNFAVLFVLLVRPQGFFGKAGLMS